MSTITKLNIAVNNYELPILTEDGKLVNAFVAQYVSKLAQKEYSLTSEELAAVSTLIDDAIAHGWLQYVDYLFPFIGNKTHLAAAMVPLVDRFTGSEVYQDTPLADTLFTYKEDAVSIKAFGYPGRPSVTGARGLIMDKFYTVKNQLIGIAPDSDFSSVLSSDSTALTICGFVPDGYGSISNQSRTNRTIRGGASEGEMHLYRWNQSSATGQASVEMFPRVSLESIESDFLLHINGGQADGKYVQYCVRGDGQVLRDYAGAGTPNSYLATPAMPFFGSQNVNGSGILVSITPPRFELMIFGVLNELTTGDVNREIGADILKFERALGKID